MTTLRVSKLSQIMWFVQSKLWNSYSGQTLTERNGSAEIGSLRENDDEAFPLALAMAFPFLLHVPRLSPRTGRQNWVKFGKFRRGFCGILNGAAPR